MQRSFTAASLIGGILSATEVGPLDGNGSNEGPSRSPPC